MQIFNYNLLQFHVLTYLLIKIVSFPAIFNPYKCITENKLHAFLSLSHSYNSSKETTKLTSPLLRHIQEHGNTTVYQWRTGKVPSVCCSCWVFFPQYFYALTVVWVLYSRHRLHVASVYYFSSNDLSRTYSIFFLLF